MNWVLAVGILGWAGEAFAASSVDASSAMTMPRVVLGDPQTVLASGALGLKYFPDSPLAVIRTRPDCRVILTAGISSFLLEGPSMGQFQSATKVLAPGKPGEFDNGYAGIRGVWRDPAGDLGAFRRLRPRLVARR